jgi:hypothetical protein
MAFDDINVPKSNFRGSNPGIQPNQGVSEEKSYVYDNTEVRKTGRKAEKTLTSGKKDIQFEVTPKNQVNGVWKKWVRDSDLYEVADDE